MAARILEGKSPKEATNLLPLLFSLCGTAQLQAGLSAIEEALGYVTSPAHIQARKILLQGESISEHVTRILIDWPELAGIDNDVACVRDLRRLLGNFKIHLFDKTQNDRIGGAPLKIDKAALLSDCTTLIDKLEQVIFGQSLDEFLSMTSQTQMMNWVETQDVLPAKCLKIWNKEDLLSAVWPEIQFLPLLDKNFLNDTMDNDKSEGFISQPTYQNTPCETGSFARHIDQGLTKAMVAALGYGPLSRFTAKLIDLALMLKEMRKLTSDFDQETALFHTKALHKGLGQIEAVRGKLTHRVWLDDDGETITRYRILAPTEWNFHPDGPLQQALVGSDASEPEKLKQTARIAVMALDPCVACDIMIRN